MVSGVFKFSSSSRQQCVNITIINNNVFEPSVKTFYVDIDTSVNRIVLDPKSTMVQIVDDGDRKGGREREREREGGRDG